VPSLLAPDTRHDEAERPARHEGGVIKDARQRQNRRRALGASAILVALLISAGLVRGAAHQSHAGHAAGAAGPGTASDSAMLAQEPDLGVACGAPNSIRCDRVGLAIWLHRPASSVTAILAGVHFALDDPTWSGPAMHGQRTMFAGFLKRTGLLSGKLKVRPDRGRFWWAGGHPASARMLIVATYADGQRASVTTVVPLRAGWG
jgi:hypothetical protein